MKLAISIMALAFALPLGAQVSISGTSGGSVKIGGGTVSSAGLTTGVYPIASATQQLSDGMIDYGHTVTDYLTINATNTANTALDVKTSSGFTLTDAGTGSEQNGISLNEQGGGAILLSSTGPNGISLQSSTATIQMYSPLGILITGPTTSTPGAINLFHGITPPTPIVDSVQITVPDVVTAYSVTLPGAQGTGCLTNDGSGKTSWSAATIYSVAGTPLPTCNAGAKGIQLVVSDATLPTFLGTYSGSGAVVSPVMCNGTNWVTY